MRHQFTALAATLLLASSIIAPAQSAPAPSAAQTQSSQANGVLSAAATEKLLPPSIFFKGQLATVQSRNSGAVRFPNGATLVATMVDSSGYSSAIRERFQLYLMNETPLRLAGKSLLPGCYGAGFLENGTFIVMDIGSHELLSVKTEADPSLKRPRPLQIIAGSGTGQFRLYNGRTFVTFEQGRE